MEVVALPEAAITHRDPTSPQAGIIRIEIIPVAGRTITGRLRVTTRARRRAPPQQRRHGAEFTRSPTQPVVTLRRRRISGA